MTGTIRQEVDAGERRPMGVGLIAAGPESSSIIDDCGNRLEHFFQENLPDFDWRVEREDWPAQWNDSLSLLDKVRSRMDQASWQFGFAVTDAQPPGSHDTSPGTVSFSHSAAIIYLSGLIPKGEASNNELVVQSCCDAILGYFARLNGLRHFEEGTQSIAPSNIEPIFSAQDLKELNVSLNSLADGVLKRGVKEIRGLGLYLRISLAHPMRVLGAVLAHRPLRMVFSLSKLVFAAMAALILSLLSTELWHLGVGINAWRLALIAIAVILAATLYVVFRQQLFVRKVSLSLSEQAAFFNLTSFLTIFAVFLLLFVIIFSITMLISLSIYPRYIIREWLQKNSLGFADYAKVSLLISSLALVVGALGAGLEENQHFRQVMYIERNN